MQAHNTRGKEHKKMKVKVDEQRGIVLISKH
jgi:hypothetical protein